MNVKLRKNVVKENITLAIIVINFKKNASILTYQNI